MTVIIELVPFDECADPGHEMGLTEAAYEQLVDALGQIGEVATVRKAPG
jgi:hypothetical protein